MKIFNGRKMIVVPTVVFAMLAIGVFSIAMGAQVQNQNGDNSNSNTSSNTNDVSQEESQNQEENQHQIQTNNQNTEVDVNNENTNKNNINITMPSKPRERVEKRVFVPETQPETGVPAALFAGPLVSIPLGLALRKYRR